MPWIDRILKLMPEATSRKQLRSFGLIVGGIFLLIGLWPLLRYGRDLRMWAFAPGLILALSALVVPALLRQPYRLWMLLGFALGWINTRIILSVVFYLVFTPVSIVMKVIRRDAMQRSIDPDADTYRVDKSPRATSHMKHQF